MDFFSIGSLSQYGKTLRLQTHWDLKKRTGEVKSHKSLDDMLKKTPTAAVLQRQIDEQNEQKDSAMERITQKLMLGKKLTPDEMRYLQQKHPELYEKVRGIEQEEKAYESELKRCRTKEEAQRLRLQKLGASLSAVNQAMHDPAMANRRFELVMTERRRVQRLEKKLNEFVHSKRYHDLPTDAEESEALHEEAEKALRELGARTGGPLPAAQSSRKAERAGSSASEEAVYPEDPAEDDCGESDALRKVRRARRNAVRDTVRDGEEAEPSPIAYNASGKTASAPQPPTVETEA